MAERTGPAGAGDMSVLMRMALAMGRAGRSLLPGILVLVVLVGGVHCHHVANMGERPRRPASGCESKRSRHDFGEPGSPGGQSKPAPSAKPATGSAAPSVAAGPAAAVFKQFSQRNFRHNLGQLTGSIPKNAQAHHVLPVKFEPTFTKAGINIHEPRFGAWWESSGHLKNAQRYNKRWEDFMRTERSQEEIFDFGRKIAKDYGLTIHF